MDELKLEQMIRNTLHESADGLHAPDELKTRVKFAVNSGAPAQKRPMKNWKKRVIALGAVAAIAVTGAFAGGMGGIYSRGWSNQRMDHDETLTHMQAISDTIELPEAFGDGFLFQYGHDTANTGEYMGKTEDRDSVEAVYVKDGVKLELSVQEPFTVFEGVEVPEAGGKQTATVGEIELTFRDTAYMFVPPGYEPTAEEKQAEADGDLVISVGTDEVEHRQFTSVSWSKDGMDYSLYGFDTGLDAQTMFDFAAEIIGA